MGVVILRKLLMSKSGEGYIDVCIIVLVAIMVIALMMTVIPALIAKNQLNNFANELAREAEIVGMIGSETSSRESVLRERTGLSPTVSWNRSGKVQLNQEFTVTCTMVYNIGFGEFGSFPVTLKSKASGKSEVYWK